ncbi:hypothetical protein G7B40_025175 [Aetokthonos hydrillicola Thurmond2011]|jgi:hypothetical protein|uniref:Uncharacterized protein n=1 Tax=Aetokthonos hydrillicola Thurmond2011 TaxID=2712845 RepID=A0AAP5MA47_9CYAN|nr:hypothetical protein [Aetokthonos hydrillicola]MBO3458450.1 hypothetical protein [Aetokthonos hydrillicola CCALA 1050]MBW4586223.1 hypothetical protein [Aetokthonos hydrillicola CCALA 1050]MDR9897830.1 hypothetical protein [Aetokthonos hydrillicola Thurmond2011]
MLILNAEMLELLEKDYQKFEQYLINHRYPTTNPNVLLDLKNDEELRLLIQQLMMGLPIEPFVEAYPELAQWMEQLHPIISIPAENKQCNISREKLVGNCQLIADYNLLIEGLEKVVAINWTIKKDIPDPENLENSYHTQLQLFLLAETLEIIADNISITYCFINGADYPSIYQFNYSQQKHDAFIKRLAMTLSKLPNTSNTNEPILSLENDMNEHKLNLQKFFKGEMTTTEYLATVPEVEI